MQVSFSRPQPATKWVPHPSFAWVGWHEPPPATSQSSTNWVPQVPGTWGTWDNTSLHPPLSIQPKKWVPPSKLCLGGIPQTPSWICHPEVAAATEGSAAASRALNPPQKWVSLRAPAERSSSVEWIQASLGWDSTNLHPPVSIQPTNMGPTHRGSFPSARVGYHELQLREFVILRSPRATQGSPAASRTLNPPQKWVPHPSFAWVG